MESEDFVLTNVTDISAFIPSKPFPFIPVSISQRTFAPLLKNFSAGIPVFLKNPAQTFFFT